MAIDKQWVDEFEGEYKNKLFDKLAEQRIKQSEAIRPMEKNLKDLGQNNVEIPNTSITVNNKVVELLHIFEDAGISMFSMQFEKENMVMPSFIGEALIDDLFAKEDMAIKELERYGSAIEEFTKKINEKVQALQKVSPMKKFFSRIRAFFVGNKPIELGLREEQRALNKATEDYREADNQIWTYNLRENIVPALVKYITGSQKFGEFNIEHRYRASDVPGLIEECIIPDLQKLGLEDLVPELQTALVEEYKKDLPDPEIYRVTDQEMDMYVPDFSKKHEEKQNIQPATRSNIEQMGENSEIGLKTFEAIDASVSAQQRQVTTGVIKEQIAREEQEKDSYSQKIQQDDFIRD